MYMYQRGSISLFIAIEEFLHRHHLTCYAPICNAGRGHRMFQCTSWRLLINRIMRMVEHPFKRVSVSSQIVFRVRSSQWRIIPHRSKHSIVALFGFGEPGAVGVLEPLPERGLPNNEERWTSPGDSKLRFCANVTISKGVNEGRDIVRSTTAACRSGLQ